MIARTLVALLLLIVGLLAPLAASGPLPSLPETRVWAPAISDQTVNHGQRLLSQELHRSNAPPTVRFTSGDAVGPTSGAQAAVNPRLTTRLDKWRSYKAGDGTMSLQQWVRHTKAASWGHGRSGGFGRWIRGVESTHGNSALTRGPHDVYAIMDANSGALLRVGETGRGLTRFAEHQRAFGKLGIDIDYRHLGTVSGNRAA